MAKKLIATGYTINASQNQITVPGIIQPVRLLLITDINNNKLLVFYAFRWSIKNANSPLFL